MGRKSHPVTVLNISHRRSSATHFLCGLLLMDNDRQAREYELGAIDDLKPSIRMGNEELQNR